LVRLDTTLIDHFGGINSLPRFSPDADTALCLLKIDGKTVTNPPNRLVCNVPWW
jgi:hypothetical protein